MTNHKVWNILDVQKGWISTYSHQAGSSNASHYLYHILWSITSKILRYFSENFTCTYIKFSISVRHFWKKKHFAVHVLPTQFRLWYTSSISETYRGIRSFHRLLPPYKHDSIINCNITASYWELPSTKPAWYVDSRSQGLQTYQYTTCGGSTNICNESHICGVTCKTIIKRYSWPST